MAPKTKHLDEARTGAVKAMKVVLEQHSFITAAAIVDDLYGRVSVTLWLQLGGDATKLVTLVRESLADACGQFFADIVTVSTATRPESDEDILSHTAWAEGTPVDGTPRLRLNDRHRNHTSWFIAADRAAGEQCWPADKGPPVVVFHGFKGGVGRTTLLASYAIACARRGLRVAVVDMDLDAPGIGVLLGSDPAGTTARWGTVDYFLEAAHELPLDDYFHVCAREKVTGSGKIEVFPAGALDDGYLPKLGRVDLNVRTDVREHPLGKLLERIRAERAPDIVLMDGRAGLSPAAGLLLSGIAHLHVLVATSNVQSLRGLERVIHHMGFEQARKDLPQRECVVVQAHVPDNSESAKSSRSFFAARVESFFRDGYYSRVPTEDDRTWSLRDLESEVAPHVPVPISYRERFAYFATIDDVADSLQSDPDHMAFHHRLDERLGLPVPGADGQQPEDGDV